MPQELTTTLHPIPRRPGLLSLGVAILLTGASSSACSPPSLAGVPARARTVTLTSTLDRSAVLAGGEGLVRMELVLRARGSRGARARVLPTDMVVVFDRSGSMSGQKIEDAKNAVRELVAQLGPEDRFALVTYASDARVDVPLSSVTEEARQGWHAAIAGLRATSNTNMSWGLDFGIRELERSRSTGRIARLILVSDGLANEGDASLEGLTARARKVARAEHAMTTVGVGLDFDERLMTTLADAGTGNFYFIEEAARLAGVFHAEFAAARETVAQGVAITLRPEAGVQLVDAAGYPLEWKDGVAMLRPGALFAGQERRIWLTMHAPTSSLGTQPLVGVSVSYTDEGKPASVALAEVPHVTCVEGEARAVASIDRDAWGRSVVSEEYRALQQLVAQAVKEGRKEDALKHIEGYVVMNSALNASVQSKDVDDNMEEAKRLSAQVDEAFTGADQPAKQNRMGKEQWSLGLDARRGGAKRSAP